MHAGPEPCNTKHLQTLQTDVQAPTSDQTGKPTADRRVGALTNDRVGDVATEEGAGPENCTDRPLSAQAAQRALCRRRSA